MFNKIQAVMGAHQAELRHSAADNKSLMVFPILSATATLVVMASFIFPVYTSGAYRHVGGQRTPTDYLLLFAFYFVCYFVQIFFNCALMASANQAFCGGKANVSDGLGMAWARLPQIIMYAAFAATVGMILRTLEERVGLVGRIIIRVLGVTWSVMTYFIAPVIVFEGLGAFEGVNRSAGLIKKTWGESLVSGLSWIAVTLMMVLAGVVAFVRNAVLRHFDGAARPDRHARRIWAVVRGRLLPDARDGDLHAGRHLPRRPLPLRELGPGSRRATAPS
jgi:hypothetical protein